MDITKTKPLDSDESRATGMLATVFPLTFIAALAVVLRMTTRIWIVRSVGWDDYTIILAIFGKIIGCSLVVVQIHYGFGRHVYFLTPSQYIEFERYSYGEWIQTFQTLMFTKISICFFLLRIPIQKIFIRPIHAAIVALVVSNLVLTLVWILQCNPIARVWDKEKPGRCLSSAQLQDIIMAQALISIISDYLLALFPIALLWRVQIALRTKIGLCILMGLGLITAALCTVRTVLGWQNVSPDHTWASVTNWYWRAWEVFIGITVACIPTLPPAYRSFTATLATFRSSRKQIINKSSDADDNQKIFHGQAYRAYSVDAQAVSKEASRTQLSRTSQEGFAMRSLPRGTVNADQQVKKTTDIDISGASMQSIHESQNASLEFGDVEKGFKNADIF